MIAGALTVATALLACIGFIPAVRLVRVSVQDGGNAKKPSECRSTWDETTTQKCRHSKGKSNCKSVSWRQCKWANFQVDGAANYPGIQPFMAVPKRGTPSPLPEGEGFVVMSDIDDTIKCSGGAPMGVDTRCDKGSFYPGVAEFQLALARGPHDVEHPRKVIPFSARPDQLGFLALKEDSPLVEHFRQNGRDAGFEDWGIDVEKAQYGSLPDFSDFVTKVNETQTRYAKFGYRKYKNWKSAPNIVGQSVFVGDNGQGDLVAAQMMLKRSQGDIIKNPVQAVFIHDVLNKCGERESACQKRWAELGVFMFDHYATAASMAYNEKLISREGYCSVCVAARYDGLKLSAGTCEPICPEKSSSSSSSSSLSLCSLVFSLFLLARFCPLRHS